jgi:hypothetical protein
MATLRLDHPYAGLAVQGRSRGSDAWSVVWTAFSSCWLFHGFSFTLFDTMAKVEGLSETVLRQLAH